MKKLQGYKFRLEPKLKTIVNLNQSLGCNRFVWNKLLAMNLHRLRNKLPIIWYNEMAWFITLWKSSEEYSFLNLAPSQSLQQTAKGLDRAFRDAFDKNQPNKRIPIFKRLGKNEAGVRYPQGFTLDQNNKVINLPKLKWVKYRKSRNIEGVVKNVTVSRKAGKYTISLQTEREVSQPTRVAKDIVGIDLGVKRFATLSSGEVIEPINIFRSQQEKLILEQRKLKNKTKFSQNWKNQQQKIRKIHLKNAHVRSDFLHKTSTDISKSHAIVALEDLKITNMSASAKGTLEAAGNRVKQKSGLNKSILDQGWGEFRKQLKYKMHWLGGQLITVPPQYTSQECPNCSYVSKSNRKTQAIFACVSCNYSDNADFVAALNIKRAGLARLACEVSMVVNMPAAGTSSVLA